MCRWYCSNLPNGTSTQPVSQAGHPTARLTGRADAIRMALDSLDMPGMTGHLGRAPA